MAQLPAVAHIALTVTDLAVSVPWYERLLGTKPVLDEDTASPWNCSHPPRRPEHWKAAWDATAGKVATETPTPPAVNPY